MKEEQKLEGICFVCSRHIYTEEGNFEWLKVKNGGFSLHHISHKDLLKKKSLKIK